MHAFDIIIPQYTGIAEDDDSHDHDVFCYLGDLEGNGQILPRNHHLAVSQNDITRVTVVCPEMDALDRKNMNSYAQEMHNKIEQLAGKPIQTLYIGEDHDYPLPRYAVPTQSEFYMLRWGWSSPLLDGVTLQGIPLYKIPYTQPDHPCYDNVWSWYRQAEALYRLWLGSQPVSEAFALEQMQSPNSEHSKIGRELCRIIEQSTGVPTYYFLMNYRDWTKAEDMEQKCPLTGQDWLLPANTYHYIDFKCDESRLVSELSQNWSDESED